MVFKEK